MMIKDASQLANDVQDIFEERGRSGSSVAAETIFWGFDQDYAQKAAFCLKLARLMPGRRAFGVGHLISSLAVTGSTIAINDYMGAFFSLVHGAGAIYRNTDDLTICLPGTPSGTSIDFTSYRLRLDQKPKHVGLHAFAAGLLNGIKRNGVMTVGRGVLFASQFALFLGLISAEKASQQGEFKGLRDRIVNFDPEKYSIVWRGHMDGIEGTSQLLSRIENLRRAPKTEVAPA